jgi:hypothetical protein
LALLARALEVRSQPAEDEFEPAFEGLVGEVEGVAVGGVCEVREVGGREFADALGEIDRCRAGLRAAEAEGVGGEDPERVQRGLVLEACC